MPTMTVQVPDADGTMGNWKGGAGNVNAVWADPESTAPMAPSAVTNAANNVRCAPPLMDERRPAWTACFIGGPLTPGAILAGSARVVRSGKMARQHCR